MSQTICENQIPSLVLADYELLCAFTIFYTLFTILFCVCFYSLHYCFKRWKICDEIVLNEYGVKGEIVVLVLSFVSFLSNLILTYQFHQIFGKCLNKK